MVAAAGKPEPLTVIAVVGGPEERDRVIVCAVRARHDATATNKKDAILEFVRKGTWDNVASTGQAACRPA